VPKSWQKAFLATCFAGAAAVAHQAMPVAGVSKDWDQRLVPRPELAQAAALGFQALVADYYWLLAIQIVGAETNPARYAPLIGQLIDVVTTLDPWVDHPYRFAALWLSDSPESVREGNRLLERGIAYHPREWRNRFYLGFNHFYYLGDNAAAADVLEGAVALEGTPVFLRRLMARLRADAEGLDTAAAFLTQLVRTAPDGYARAEYRKALDEVEAERRARFLDAARADYQRRTGRDITAVEDLVRPPHAVLPALPPEPNGWEWILDPNTGRIVSSYYKRRYEVSVRPGQHPWPERRRESSESRGGAGT
jgi:hypothetical protein